MRVATIPWLGLCTMALLAPAGARPLGEHGAVLAAVKTMLDAWREADAEKLDGVLHTGFREVTLHLDDGKWNFAPVAREQLIETLRKIDKGAWDDRLLDPHVQVDGPIAVVWSHYRFTVHFTEGGAAKAAAHCGVETFQLYRVDGAWKIVNFADTHGDCAGRR